MDDLRKRIKDEQNYEKKFKKLVNECQKLWQNSGEDLAITYWEIGDLIVRFEDGLSKERRRYNLKTILRRRLGELLESPLSVRHIGKLVDLRKLFPDCEQIDESIPGTWYFELLNLSTEEERTIFMKKIRNNEFKKNREALREAVNKHRSKKK